jgi:hypothetical protein
MPCCEKKNHKDDVERCLMGGANGGRRCMCLPYDDGIMIAAQILSIVAFLVSWIWWVSLIIATIALLLHQIIWCCRQSKVGFIAVHVVSIVAGTLNLFVGFFFLVYWKDSRYCGVFIWLTDDWDDDYSDFNYDHCPQVAWASAAFVDAALWFATAGCTIAFVCSGRYAKWEERRSNETTNNVGNKNGGAEAAERAVEMGNVETTKEQQQQLVTVEAESIRTITATAEAEADSYVPPVVTAEVDVDEVTIPAEATNEKNDDA